MSKENKVCPECGSQDIDCLEEQGYRGEALYYFRCKDCRYESNYGFEFRKEEAFIK